MNNKYIFLFKEKDTDDRDCVRYIELKDLIENHTCIDGKFNVHGACYSMSLKEKIDYEYVTTILSEEEYKMLCNPDKNYDYSEIIKKLVSEENEQLFAKVQEEEKEWLMENYNLEEEDVESIFNEYYLDYRDRAVVACVFDSVSDFGYDEAYSLGYIKDNDPITTRYFDYEKFGEDLLEEEQYLELDNGRVVCLCY